MAEELQLPGLDLATKKKAATITRRINAVRNDARRLTHPSLQQIDDVAYKYSRAPSTFLAAVVGGAIGSAGGITLAAIGAGALVLTGPLGLAVGAAVSVLAFRGKSYWRLELATQKTKGAIELIKSEINSLPKDAPEHIRQNLYREYEQLITTYTQVAGDTIDEVYPRDITPPPESGLVKAIPDRGVRALDLES
jgi:hypothetical protein